MDKPHLANCRLAVSFSCLSNSRRVAQPYRCRVSGATGGNDYTPTLREWNKNLQSNYKTTEYHYQTQVEIPVTTADFYFPLESRPLLMFVDGRVHLRTAQ